MRFVGALLVAVATGSVAWAGTDVVPKADDGKVADLERRVSALEAQVKTIEALMKLAGVAPTTPVAQAPPSPSADQAPAQLKLVRWSAALKRGEFQPVYEMSYTIENDSAKPVKLIDASIAFSDALGDEFYGIRCQKDVAIRPGKTQTFGGQYEVNQFKPEEARLASMNKADVVAKLIIHAVVFADNSVAKFGQ